MPNNRNILIWFAAAILALGGCAELGRQTTSKPVNAIQSYGGDGGGGGGGGSM